MKGHLAAHPEVHKLLFTAVHVAMQSSRVEYAYFGMCLLACVIKYDLGLHSQGGGLPPIEGVSMGLLAPVAGASTDSTGTDTAAVIMLMNALR